VHDVAVGVQPPTVKKKQEKETGYMSLLLPLMTANIMNLTNERLWTRVVRHPETRWSQFGLFD